jgi:hypothetical protein
LKCGLVCCTYDLKLAMLEKIYIHVKNPIYTKFYPCFMIQMVSSHIYIFCLFVKTCPCATDIYFLLALCQNPLNIIFSGSFRSFWNCRGSFYRTCPTLARTYPASQTCPAQGLDMSGSWVSSLYKGVECPP